jgi:hypothetical protein
MELKQAIKFWFSLHGKSAGVDFMLARNGNTGFYAITTGKEDYVDVTICEIGNHQFLLIEDLMVISHDHPITFAFYKKKDGKVLLARYFWCSRSEGCWRSGTGFRPAQDREGNKYYDFFGGFIKGQEHIFGGGYTFETQIHPVLEEKLSERYRDRLKKETLATIDLNKDITDKAIKDCLIRPQDTVNLPSTNILKQYMDEVKIVAVLDEKIRDKTFTQSLEKSHGATTIQELAQPKNPTLKEFKKSTSELWQALIGCLELSPINKKPYSYYSELLEKMYLKKQPEEYKKNVNVESYLLQKQTGKVLENVVIEMAYTSNSYDMAFKNKALTMTYRVNSPICWVKSVYLPEDISSFGNYGKYPWDLCFLPQKPMDYDKQISDYLKKRESTKPDEDYTSLALCNEKYSPLVRAFKIIKGFNMIKTTAAYATIEEYLRGLNNAEFLVYLKTKLVQSCVNYLDYNRENPSVVHGSKGRNRVTSFIDVIFDAQSYADLSKATYELFVKNTVKGTCYTSWAGTGKIATRASSYIVFFCDALYETMVIDINENARDAGVKKVEQFQLSIKDKKLKGKEHALTRAAIFMKGKRISGHVADSDTLKEIIAAMAANV